jgi:hypothetical protein
MVPFVSIKHPIKFWASEKVGKIAEFYVSPAKPCATAWAMAGLGVTLKSKVDVAEGLVAYWPSGGIGEPASEDNRHPIARWVAPKDAKPSYRSPDLEDTSGR